MLVCWESVPSERPSFLYIVESLSNTLENAAGYIDMSTISEGSMSKLFEQSSSVDKFSDKCCTKIALNKEPLQQNKSDEDQIVIANISLCTTEPGDTCDETDI